MLVGIILRKSAGDKKEKFKACIINLPVQYLKKKKRRRVLYKSPVMQIPQGSQSHFEDRRELQRGLNDGP